MNLCKCGCALPANRQFVKGHNLHNKKTSSSDRFWIKAVILDISRCWEWVGACTPAGYGRFYFKGRSTPAHQVAYVLTFGRIPSGMELDHLCKNRRCVNPHHLEAVSHRENVCRGNAGIKSGAEHRARTHCPKGHEYTAENTRWTNGTRTCRACSRVYDKRRREAKRLAVEGLEKKSVADIMGELGREQ